MKTISEAVRAFLFHCRYEKKLSEKTMKAYSQDCRQFTGFLNSEKIPVGEIGKQHIKDYLRHLELMKPKTLRRKIATLKAMFNFLEFEDEILVNPFRKMRIVIREPKLIPKSMSLPEVSKILNYAQSCCNKPFQRSENLTRIERIRNLALLELLFASGMRVAEICNLKPDDLELESGTIKIMGKGSRQRVIHVYHPEVLKSLHCYSRKNARKIIRSGYFFTNRNGNRISEQSVRFMVRRYTQRAGLKRHITPHVFRHSFATLMLERDVDIKYIQQFLGHSSITTTQIYTHVNISKQQEILREKHPRLVI